MHLVAEVDSKVWLEICLHCLVKELLHSVIIISQQVNNSKESGGAVYTCSMGCPWLFLSFFYILILKLTLCPRRMLSVSCRSRGEQSGSG